MVESVVSVVFGGPCHAIVIEPFLLPYGLKGSPEVDLALVNEGTMLPTRKRFQLLCDQAGLVKNLPANLNALHINMGLCDLLRMDKISVDTYHGPLYMLRSGKKDGFATKDLRMVQDFFMRTLGLDPEKKRAECVQKAEDELKRRRLSMD